LLDGSKAALALAERATIANSKIDFAKYLPIYIIKLILK
jgi:hypothetical protein